MGPRSGTLRPAGEGFREQASLIPSGFGQVEWALEMLLETVPAATLLYGSDEAGEP
ncbi:MAG TPA: hypothetical protein VJ774_02580 [Actinomycetota bacterium]|nr:hypothetical protein [Actinomycetota bacterium]